MANDSRGAPGPGDALAKDLLDALDRLSGLHPGFRPAHAKGLMCGGVFTPSAGAERLTRAPHAGRPSTPVVVRFSNSGGLPTVPDNDPAAASPRGMAVRFQLGEHVHTDIIAHSTDAFPCRTGEEFLEFLKAAAGSGPGAAHPTPIESFLATHPAALRFIQLPKPIPTSYARESYFSVVAYSFTGVDGAGRFGRYHLRPEAGNEYLTAEQAAARSPEFLHEEIGARLAAGPVRFRVLVQLAGEGDATDDATAVWPADRPEVEFGTIQLTKRLDDREPELRKIIFDPIPRVDGIEASGDPLLPVRAAIYLLSGRRRRAAGGGARCRLRWRRRRLPRNRFGRSEGAGRARSIATAPGAEVCEVCATFLYP